MLARVNNVEKHSQIRKWNKWTNSKEWHTETHTRIDNWGRATKEWAQNVESTKMLVLHNSRETLARLLNRRIQHLCTTYKMQMDKLLSQVCYVCIVPGVSLKMIQYDRIWQSYVQWGMMLWHLLTSFFALFLLLKSIISFFSMATFAQCTNKDSNCVYAGTPRWYGMYAKGSMITNVHK